MKKLLPLLVFLGLAVPAQAATMQDVLSKAQASDWRPLDPENTLYLELPGGRVVIELASDFAPNTLANIRTLVREGFFDGTSINRVQENYVVQWGDATEKKPQGSAKPKIAAEFTRALKGLNFSAIRDVDGYAPKVGFANGFPVAANSKTNKAWLTHCYASVGVGRGATLDSGNGSELYVVIGHAPRHLDLNVAVVGRVLQGMDLLSTLPRGTGPLGFYEKDGQRVPIKLKLAAQVPEAERSQLERLRTDTPLFQQLVDVRRNRKDDWFQAPANYVDLCNVPLPVRAMKVEK
jgi:peptidylprolyl isomerase